jgi:hypothetical protein
VSARNTLVLVGVAVAALLLGGCRADEPTAAPPAPSVPAGSAEPSVPAGSADPLAGVESVVDDIERDLDADAGLAGR